MKNKKIGNKEIKEDTQEVDKKYILNKKRIYKLAYYILLFILCIFVKSNISEIDVVLGDFGSILPVLLKILSISGITWCPILCIVGFILVFFDTKYKDLNKIYLILTTFITVCSFLLLLII